MSTKCFTSTGNFSILITGLKNPQASSSDPRCALVCSKRHLNSHLDGKKGHPGSLAMPCLGRHHQTSRLVEDPSPCSLGRLFRAHQAELDHKDAVEEHHLGELNGELRLICLSRQFGPHPPRF
ncbi:hypothetical protein NL676_035248 [Syzygium grande]|nr:hypothetical protein NL676_035248 [Syzygium grande]